MNEPEIKCYRGTDGNICVSDGADIHLGLDGARSLRDELTEVLDRADRGLFDGYNRATMEWLPRAERRMTWTQ